MSILRNYSFNIGASLCVLLATLASPAGAAIVFDNGGPNTSNGWSVLGSNSTADNFSIASNTTIGSVGFYFQNYNGIPDGTRIFNTRSWRTAVVPLAASSPAGPDKT